MAFQQALSGLNSSSKAIDAVSNNIANATTVGFKGANVHFGDIFAASLSGAGASQIGIGVNLTGVQQQFSQGNITTTNNALDIAINGGGFFQMDQNGAVTYTRNGQFHVDKNGFIVNDQNLKLTGYPAQGNVILKSTPVPLVVSASTLSPQATGTNPNSPFKGVKINLNLDSRSTVPASPWVDGDVPGSTTAFTPDPATYNFSTGLTVYDSLGGDHRLTLYFRKAASKGDWEVYGNVDGTTNQNNGTPGALGTLSFDTNGQLATPSGSPLQFGVQLDQVANSLGKPANPAVDFLSFNLDFLGSTQFGSASGTNRLEQDGYAAGNLIGLSVGTDGIIKGRYSNGQSLAQGQVVLVNFTDPNGLQSLGNNQWAETSVSGPPQVGAPNTANLGVLAASAIEESNVDLTGELVNLITQQRNYQANAQSIKTQDQILQTLVNLR